MYYVVNTMLHGGKLIYDILCEANTIREAYDFLYDNNYKSYSYKPTHFHSDLYEDVTIWKETDLDKILIDYVNYILSGKDGYLGFKFGEDKEEILRRLSR